VVPPNTTAEITLPVKGEVNEGGKPVKEAPGIREATGNRLVAGSGTYRFSGSY
jgi:alpha-L-rhamnosidase